MFRRHSSIGKFKPDDVVEDLNSPCKEVLCSDSKEYLGEGQECRHQSECSENDKFENVNLINSKKIKSKKSYNQRDIQAGENTKGVMMPSIGGQVDDTGDEELYSDPYVEIEKLKTPGDCHHTTRLNGALWSNGEPEIGLRQKEANTALTNEELQLQRCRAAFAWLVDGLISVLDICGIKHHAQRLSPSKLRSAPLKELLILAQVLRVDLKFALAQHNRQHYLEAESPANISSNSRLLQPPSNYDTNTTATLPSLSTSGSTINRSTSPKICLLNHAALQPKTPPLPLSIGSLCRTSNNGTMIPECLGYVRPNQRYRLSHSLAPLSRQTPVFLENVHQTPPRVFNNGPLRNFKYINLYHKHSPPYFMSHTMDTSPGMKHMLNCCHFCG